jgi:hypothetical protein
MLRAMRAVVATLAVLVGVGACAPSRSEHSLDFDLIRVLPDARLHTDTIGEGKFAERATFVLVDAENTGREGANVTLAGELSDAAGASVGKLKAQSLYVPAGEQRTFVLIDAERKPRPTAASASIVVRGAQIPTSPLRVTIDHLREIEDDGKIVVQAIIGNDAKRAGTFMVIASFHDASGTPITRPFSMIRIDAHATQGVQFVGPPGSKRGTIFVGDAVY